MKNKEKLNSQQKTTKALKYAGLTFGLGTIITGTATIIASCATEDASTFTYYTATNFLESQNNPLNPTFSNSPIDLYSNSSMAGLVTYETTGQFKFSPETGEREESPKDNLKLEGALKLTGYDKESKVVGTIERSDKPITEHADYSKIISSAVKYEFTIDKNFKWIDKNGNVKQNLSGKDFERGLETYVLGSALGYQRNGYFIELVGLDLEQTLGAEVKDITESTYNIDNFKSSDDKYTLVLKEPYPYFLSVLTKAYFLPVPHTNEYVKAIKMAADGNTGPIIWDKKGEKKVMNPGATRFNELYGSGTDNFLDRSWFLGPYYINHFSTTQIVSLLNPYYFDNMNSTLSTDNGNKIRKVIYNYGSGNPEVFYNRFLSNQSSWIDAVPTSRRSEAQSKYSKSGELYLSGVSQISKSNYAAYTPVPYVVENNSVKENDNVSEAAAKTIFNFQSKQSTIFRAALAGLINHVDLAKLVTNSGDLQFSSIPYGVFKFSNELSQKIGAPEYYEAVSDSELQGGFPRPLSDYTTTKFGDDYIDDSNDGFKVPYYTYKSSTSTSPTNNTSNGKYEKEELIVNKDAFIKALEASGASGDKPAVWQYKFPDRSPSTEYQNYLNRLKAAIEGLGTKDGKKYITFNLVPGGGNNPSNTDWFNNRSSSIGYSGWSPDYNAVGTWHEANGMLNADSSAATNTYSIFPGLFKYMVISAKDSGATVNESGASIAADKTTPTTSSVFDNDSRIPKKIWSSGKEFAKKGVEFLDYLIKNKVLKGSEINTLLSNSESIKALDQNGNGTSDSSVNNETLTKPSSKEQLTPLSKYFVNGGAADFNKYLGVWAGQSDENALWLTVVADTQNIYIPRAESGLNETIFSLVNKNFKVRKSGAGEINLRDFEYLGK